jgi:hypothetical protein
LISSLANTSELTIIHRDLIEFADKFCLDDRTASFKTRNASYFIPSETTIEKTERNEKTTIASTNTRRRRGRERWKISIGDVSGRRKERRGRRRLHGGAEKVGPNFGGEQRE